MAYLKQLPAGAALLDVFKAYPHSFIPLIEYHQRLLRDPSPFSVAERELIAAFVSATNACAYCAGVHEATARAFGIEASILEALLAGVDSAPVSEKLKPVLRYVRKLTQTPARMTAQDADAIFAAGWDDRALHDAVAICGLFNCMNRLVEGFGIVVSPDYFNVSSRRLASAEGYLALVEILKHPPTPSAERPQHP